MIGGLLSGQGSLTHEGREDRWRASWVNDSAGIRLKGQETVPLNVTLSCPTTTLGYRAATYHKKCLFVSTLHSFISHATQNQAFPKNNYYLWASDSDARIRIWIEHLVIKQRLQPTLKLQTLQYTSVRVHIWCYHDDLRVLLILNIKHLFIVLNWTLLRLKTRKIWQHTLMWFQWEVKTVNAFLN